jgi:hypothetical protein
MSNSEKKPYKVLKPIAWGGRREIGETIFLTDEEAENLGNEYVALDSVPVTTGTKVEEEVAVEPKISRKKPLNK